MHGRIVGPSQEVCDGIDNNCDGIVDTDDPNLGLPCGQARTGSECTKGTLQIPPAVARRRGHAARVAGRPGAGTELCNGLDDDCDGKADEAENGVKPEARPEVPNGANGVEMISVDPPRPECRAGNTSCESGILLCRNEVAPEANELCDTSDHDCDGAPLNGFSPDVANGTTATSGPDTRVGKNCGIDTGECEFGIRTCHLDTRDVELRRPEVLPKTEICDGKDNDCDGKIDEHDKNGSNQDIPLAGEGVACVTNANGRSTPIRRPAPPRQCRTGTTVCTAGKLGCQGQMGPRPELCDAEDWDCNGNANNGVTDTDPAVAKPCGPPTVGVCKRGTTACVSNGGRLPGRAAERLLRGAGADQHARGEL